MRTYILGLLLVLVLANVSAAAASSEAPPQGTAPVVAAAAPAPPVLVGQLEWSRSTRQRVVQIGVLVMAIALFIIIRGRPGG
jgi:hypothetical protein